MARWNGITAPLPGGSRASADLSTGTPSMFKSLAFVEIERRKPERAILRLNLG
jgi:hypothetical protein